MGHNSIHHRIQFVDAVVVIELGLQVRFATLNTETSTAGNQAKWLNKELGQSRLKHRWRLTQYHRPAYPAVKAPGTALQTLGALV